ncbi:cell division protein ZipA [Haemophilus sputorum]
MELHILFFILAGILIAILLGFSVWSARREKSRVFSNTFSTRPPAQPIKQDPIGDIPASLNINNQYQPVAQNEPAPTADQYYTQQNYQQESYPQEEVENAVSAIKINIPGQTEAQPQIQSQPTQYHATHATTMHPTFEQTMPESIVPASQPEAASEMQPIAEQAPEYRVAENGIASLFVVAPEGQQFFGHYIVQHLETLGFQYGEYNIFHRHQHADDINSPIMFSVANMTAPGTFDLNKLDRFMTVGLVMFMHLPSDIAKMKSMISAAEGLAQLLGGFVLDEHQNLFDENARHAYLKCVQ